VVRLSRNREIVNREKLDSLIRKNGITSCRIKTKFLDDADIQIDKGDDKESFLTEIQNKVFEMAEKLPHRQVVLKIRKENTSVEIIVNPVTGAA